MPWRPQQAQYGRGRGAGERDGQHPVTQGCRPPPQEHGGRERPHENDGYLHGRRKEQRHRLPSFLAFATSSAMRSSSSSDRRPPSPPSSAPTTFSVDPSKKVSTRWRSADFRATRRASAGM